MILETKTGDTFYGSGFNINDRNGIVFLQRHIGGFAVFRDGNIFRLDILGNA